VVARRSGGNHGYCRLGVLTLSDWPPVLASPISLASLTVDDLGSLQIAAPHSIVQRRHTTHRSCPHQIARTFSSVAPSPRPSWSPSLTVDHLPLAAGVSRRMTEPRSRPLCDRFNCTWTTGRVAGRDHHGKHGDAVQRETVGCGRPLDVSDCQGGVACAVRISMPPLRASRRTVPTHYARALRRAPGATPNRGH